MGEFDDVLAMEPGDEWDDYDPTDHSGPVVELPPLAAELHAPAATVELRGDVPDELVAALDPLRASPEVSSPHRVVVALEIARVDRPDGHTNGTPRSAWGIVDGEHGELGVTGSVDELAEQISARVVDLARRADVRQLVLPAAGVRLADGRGVLIVDAAPDRRHRLVNELVAAGAGYLGADQVIALAGSRTVLACPTPLGSGGGVRAEQVVPTMTCDVVVVADDDPVVHAPERISRAHGCARLLAAALPDAVDRSEVLRSVAGLVAGADPWCVAVDDPNSAAEAVAALSGSAERELVTWRRPLPDRDDLVVVRFADGGVVVDLERAKVLELDGAELPVIDALGWSLPQDPAARTALLGQLAEAGVDLRPVAAARPAAAAGPESHGLPDAPSGDAAAAMWSAVTNDGTGADRTTRAVLLAHAADRHQVALDQPLLDEVRGIAAEAARRRETAEDLVVDVLAALADVGIDPLVVGAVVLANDGPVPADLVEVDEVGLLVAGDELDIAAQVLRGLSGAVVAEAPPPEQQGAGPSGPRRVDPAAIRVDRNDHSVQLTAQDRLAGGPFGELVDHDELWDRAVPVRLRGRWVRALHPDDRFVLACVRAVDPDGGSLRHAREVVLTAPSSREGMAAALEASARWGATRTVLDAIRLVDRRLPGLSHWLVERADRPAAGPDRRRRRGLRRR
jgi:hypothetical protein